MYLKYAYYFPSTKFREKALTVAEGNLEIAALLRDRMALQDQGREQGTTMGTEVCVTS